MAASGSLIRSARKPNDLCRYRLPGGLSSHAHPGSIRLLGALVRWQKVIVMTTIYVRTLSLQMSSFGVLAWPRIALIRRTWSVTFGPGSHQRGAKDSG
jgi:hypothetical protein